MPNQFSKVLTQADGGDPKANQGTRNQGNDHRLARVVLSLYVTLTRVLYTSLSTYYYIILKRQHSDGAPPHRYVGVYIYLLCI